MDKNYYTIGMAGHIDHGKTTLTKALTSVDTDRLKAEKERSISIEPGFAPLYHDDEMEISVVDVPGHERFIRQMIAGVAGIDFVVLVVAADEGVMPQTKEHLDILALLGVTEGMVVLSKSSRVDKELRDMAREEVLQELEGTVFEDSDVLLVDSITGEGIQELRQKLIMALKDTAPRRIRGDFRLPIDQVFTIKGQGTVVRGTVFEGSLNTGEEITILPQRIHTRAKQIQSHNRKEFSAFAGQRAAINLSRVDYKELKRGNVLVSSTHFSVTDTIDVNLVVLDGLVHPLKQRMPVVVHTGTSEVMGRLIFFDRNTLTNKTDPILCQIRLDESVVAKRGDRFIIRRPSPTETIGGGWIIHPNGGKYKFGEETIAFLQAEKKDTPKERLLRLLEQYKCVEDSMILNDLSISHEDLDELLNGDLKWIKLPQSKITHMNIVEECMNDMEKALRRFHGEYPLLKGMNSGELKQTFRTYTSELADYVIELKSWKQDGGLLSLEGFIPHLPPEWEKRCQQVLTFLQSDGTKVKSMNDYFQQAGIPERWRSDFYHFFIQEKKIVPLDDEKSYSYQVFMEAVANLKENTGKKFDLSEAKEILGVSRKYMIPFLERLDKDGLTLRMDDQRKWIEEGFKG